MRAGGAPRRRGQARVEAGATAQVAPGDAHQLAQPQPAQAVLERRLVAGIRERRRDARGDLARRVGAREIARADKVAQQLRPLRAGAGDEIAAGEHPRQGRKPLSRLQVGEMRRELAPLALDPRAQWLRNGGQGGIH